MYKAISFEQWLSSNYPDEVLNGLEEVEEKHACLQCEGSGFLDVAAAYPDTCLLCMGTGSDRYSEYAELTAIEREKWNKWQVLELLGVKSNGKA